MNIKKLALSVALVVTISTTSLSAYYYRDGYRYGRNPVGGLFAFAGSWGVGLLATRCEDKCPGLEPACCERYC